jgi:hypothetical protein
MNPALRRDVLRVPRPVLGSLLCLLGLGILLCNWKWIFNAIQGPVFLSVHELSKIRDPSELPNSWITFVAANGSIMETGLGQMETASRKPISRYLLVGLESGNLVIEVPYKHKGMEFTGCLETWSWPFRESALDAVHSKFPGFRVLPYQLDALNDYQGQCWALLVFAGLVILIGIWMRVYGFALPRKKVVTSSPRNGPVPTWLLDLGDNVSPPQKTEVKLTKVFEARQVNALSADQVYRVFVEENQVFMIRIAGQKINERVPAMFAAQGGLIGGLMAGLVSRINKSQAEIKQPDALRPGDLLASHKLNFCFTAVDVLGSTIDPPSMMASHGPHAGRWSLVLKNGKKRNFQLEKIEDMHEAVRILTTVLGPLLQVNVTWDAIKMRYRKRSID